MISIDRYSKFERKSYDIYCPIEQNENFDRAKKKFFGIARLGHKSKSENKKSKSVSLCGI